MELTINSRFLVLSLIACCLIYVTSAEANDSENSGSDIDSGSGSGSHCDNCDGSDGVSSTIVATFTPTDFILLRTPYLYIWPPVLLVIILMCCCLCGMCLCLYIKNRRKRITSSFNKGKLSFEGVWHDKFYMVL